MTHYLKTHNTFRIASTGELDLSDNLPVGNYLTKLDQNGVYFLEKIPSFTTPSKIYGDTTKKANRIISTFHDRTNSTGVLLNGEKGSGKTLLLKTLSVALAEQGIPTIIVSEPHCGDTFNRLIQSIEQPAVVVFDEFEKTYKKEQQEVLLTLLDGVYSSKKLFILTSNDSRRIDTCLLNRPGRIFYNIEYSGLTLDFIKEYCGDTLNNKAHLDQICKLSTLFRAFNFDLLQALVEEINRYDETPQQAFEMLNARPDIEGSRFVVELVVDGDIVPVDDLQDDGEWRGNPLSGDGVCLRYCERGDGGGNTVSGWTYEHFESSHLTDVDPLSGKFTYVNGNNRLTLTKYVFKHFNYNTL